MDNSHEILGIAALLLWFMGSANYVRGLLLSRICPHFFSWLIWALSVSIIFAAQMAEGAGPGAWTTGFSVLLCSGIAIYAFFRGEKNFTRGDWISLIIAMISIPVWYFTTQPTYAAMISIGIDCMAYYPIFRKTILRPYDESIGCYIMDGVRHLIAFTALSHVTLTTAAYPVLLCFMSSAFVIFALWRRQVLRATMA